MQIEYEKIDKGHYRAVLKTGTPQTRVRHFKLGELCQIEVQTQLGGIKAWQLDFDETLREREVPFATNPITKKTRHECRTELEDRIFAAVIGRAETADQFGHEAGTPTAAPPQ